MKKNRQLPFLITSLAIISCKQYKICNCKEDWVINKVYYKDNLVKYHDTCWVALAQGGGTAPPGPWLQGGQDIWVPCTNGNSPKPSK
jgi:hypothetical protein